MPGENSPAPSYARRVNAVPEGERFKIFASRPKGGRQNYPLIFRYEQKRCLPMVTISGRDQIHLLVAVAGLK